MTQKYTAIVTGASSGIGRAISEKKLGVLGYEVFGIGRRFDTEEDRDIAGVLQYENDLKMPYFIQSSVTSPIRINCALS